MGKAPKVQVLMSTYNGEKYLVEQLQSILKQDYSNLCILIRDDGSTDNTLQILDEYSRLDERIKYYQSANIGAKRSFFELINNADPLSDYYALSDQDDVWNTNKISRAINKLIINGDKPLLYCCDTLLVNEKLEPMNNSIRKPLIKPSFGNALIENICTGCTCVFNRDLLYLVQNNEPNFAIMHDWWLYLCASAYGEVIYDSQPNVLYRQHGNNIVGARSNYYDEFKIRLYNYKTNRGKLYSQVNEFASKFQFNNQNRKQIELIICSKSNMMSRLRIIFNKKIYRQRKIDDIIFKVLLASRKI